MKLFLTGVGLVCLAVGLVRMKQLQDAPPALLPNQTALDAADQPTVEAAVPTGSVADEAALGVKTVQEMEALPPPREYRVWPVPFVVERASKTAQGQQFDPRWLKAPPSAEDQQRILLAATEIRIVQDFAARLYLHEQGRTDSLNSPSTVPERLASHAATVGFPWRQGETCQLSKDEALRIAELAREIRTDLFRLDLGLKRKLDPKQQHMEIVARIQPLCTKWNRPGSARMLTQILQAENVAWRNRLIEILNRFADADASVALAKLAVFDVDEGVRKKAIASLSARPAEQWRPTVMAGLEHLWPLASVHAAIVLISLKDRDALPQLIPLLNKPDPAQPFLFDQETKAIGVRELVRLNHNHNCALCHATKTPQISEIDQARLSRIEHVERRRLVQQRFQQCTAITETQAGFVFAAPTPDQPMQSFPSTAHYETVELDAFLIRLDVTYLKQDFSITLPCDINDSWPKLQRYDFITRVRPATEQEIIATQTPNSSYPQRLAVLHVLRTLTGKDGGDSPAEWEQILLNMPRE